jgi:hypothetical protein
MAAVGWRVPAEPTVLRVRTNSQVVASAAHEAEAEAEAEAQSRHVGPDRDRKRLFLNFG